MIRKNTRFRLYLAFLTAFYVVGIHLLLSRQSRASEARFASLQADYESRFRLLEQETLSKVASVSSGSSIEELASANSSPASDLVARDSVYDGPEYFVLGSGASGRWGYVDIMFLDGSRNRYYFRRDSPSDLSEFSYRVELDAFLVRWNIGRRSDSVVPWGND